MLTKRNETHTSRHAKNVSLSKNVKFKSKASEHNSLDIFDLNNTHYGLIW